MHHLHQRTGQHLAARMQLVERITHQRELVYCRFDFLQVATGQRRPDVGSCRNALAGLRQQCGVKTPKARLFVIDCSVALQPKAGIHRLPDGGLACRIGIGRGLGAEKQHVLQQALRRNSLSLGQGGRHHQHPRGHPLGVNINGQQSMRHGIEIPRRHFPENTQSRFGLRLRKTQTHLADACAGGRHVLAFDHLQHCCIQHRPLCRPVAQRLDRACNVGLPQPALYGPQIGRVHLARIAVQALHIAILRKKRHRRNALTGQHGLQILQQRKTGFFQRLHHCLGAVGRVLHKVLQRGLHGTQQQGRLWHAHHFQGPAGLVQLLLGHAQRTDIQRRQIGVSRLLRLAHKTAGGLDRRIQGFAQLFQHPCQRS